MITTDQRGIARPQGSRCDIGAFEFRTPALNGPPKVSGTPRLGQKLTCSVRVTSPDGPVTTAFTWLRGTAGVGTGSSYTVKSSDEGHSLRCHAVVRNTARSVSATSAPVAIPFAPSVTITFTQISGHTATFKFRTAHATGAQCALAKGTKAPTYSSCTSPKSYRGLAKGSYTFYVRALGSGGTKSAPAKQSFRIT